MYVFGPSLCHFGPARETQSNHARGYWLWPFGTPDIESVIDRSTKRVARLINKDYPAPMKVECCGFTIFRCCHLKQNAKANLLENYSGWDGRSRGNIMYTRGVTNHIDMGEPIGRYLLEDDAYEAEQKL